MNKYFYLIHVFKPNQISIEIPLYIEAANINDAKKHADVVKSRLCRQFELLLEPPEPKLLVPSINEASLTTFFTKLGNGQKVTFEFIPSISFNLYQFNSNPGLQIIEGLVLITGNNQLNQYELNA